MKRGVTTATRRGQSLLAVFYSMRILPMRLATVPTQVPFQLRDFALYKNKTKVKKSFEIPVYATRGHVTKLDAGTHDHALLSGQ